MTENADRLYERLLILRCQAGNEEAFALLVERHQSRLRYYVRKMLYGLREPDDVLQEIWLDVFRAIARLVDADAFRAWLYQVARARALKEFRKRRLNFRQLEQIDEELANDAGQDSEIFAAEEAQSVHAALDKLAPTHREVLVLRYIEDMSYEEIARVTDSQVGTVRSRLHYGKRALRAYLEKDRHNER
jgi:RNA polymerase sigma-70 factor (ECF subfamily)